MLLSYLGEDDALPVLDGVQNSVDRSFEHQSYRPTPILSALMATIGRARVALLSYFLALYSSIPSSASVLQHTQLWLVL